MAQKTQIGKILLEKKKISQSQLGQALKRQLVSGGRLASNLLDIGAASEEDLLGALGEQMGIPAVDLSRTVIPITALKIIPERVAIDAKILPLKVDEERIFLAVGDPNDKQTLDEVTFVTGRKVEAYIALETRLVTVIHEAYDLLKTGSERRVLPRSARGPASRRRGFPGQHCGYFRSVAKARHRGCSG